MQFQWPFDPADLTWNTLTDPVGNEPFDSGYKTDWDPKTLGTATLGGTADGVTFDGGYNAIGVLDALSNVGSVLDLKQGA